MTTMGVTTKLTLIWACLVLLLANDVDALDQGNNGNEKCTVGTACGEGKCCVSANVNAPAICKPLQVENEPCWDSNQGKDEKEIKSQFCQCVKGFTCVKKLGSTGKGKCVKGCHSSDDCLSTECCVFKATQEITPEEHIGDCMEKGALNDECFADGNHMFNDDGDIIGSIDLCPCGGDLICKPTGTGEEGKCGHSTPWLG